MPSVPPMKKERPASGWPGTTRLAKRGPPPDNRRGIPGRQSEDAIVTTSSATSEGGVIKSLRHIALLAEAPADLLGEIEGMASWSEVDANQIVIERDDTSTDIYFISKGRVQVIDFLEGRPEIVLAELSAGDYFGDLSAIDHNKRSARVTTVEPTLLASLDCEQFHDLVMRCPEIGFSLLRKFATLVRAMTVKVTALSSLTPHQRVFLELLRISEPNPLGDGSWVIKELPNHTQISSTVGTEKEVVAMAIGELAREKVVERKHKSLIIKDYPRLQMLTNL